MLISVNLRYTWNNIRLNNLLLFVANILLHFAIQGNVRKKSLVIVFSYEKYKDLGFAENC